MLEQGLRSAESELDAEPPEPMPDMPVGPGAEVADLQGRLELLQQEAERLRRQVPWLKKLVGGGRPLDGSDRDQVLAIAAAVQGIDSDCDAALKMLVSIKERGAYGAAVAELGTLEAGLQDIGTGALPRLLPKAMRLVEPAASEAGADGGGSGRERLQRALEHIDARVDERCRDAEATFAAYPADVWRLPEMRALRILVRDGAARPATGSATCRPRVMAGSWCGGTTACGWPPPGTSRSPPPSVATAARWRGGGRTRRASTNPRS